MSTTDRKRVRQLAVDRRKTWETLEALKKRFAGMVGKGSLTPNQLVGLSDSLKGIKSLFEEYTDAPIE